MNVSLEHFEEVQMGMVDAGNVKKACLPMSQVSQICTITYVIKLLTATKTAAITASEAVES